MKAMVYAKYGPPEVLRLEEVEKPSPKDDEVLIRVRATSVTAADNRIRGSDFPPLFWLPARIGFGLMRPKTTVLGTNLAGEVEAVGKDVKRFSEGDRVFGSSGGRFGAYAEYICLPEKAAVATKPDNLTYEEAASISFGAFTSLFFLRDKGNLQPGQQVLINGASGSVGTFAVQLARAFGADVTGVCSTRNVALVQALGADRVIDYTQTDWTSTGETYDIIFDAVGTTTFAQTRRALKPDGYYLHTVLAAAAIKGVWYALTTGKHVIGGTAVPRREALLELKELSEAGRLKPVLDRCYPLEQMAEAHRYVEEGHKRGNVVITVAKPTPKEDDVRTDVMTAMRLYANRMWSEPMLHLLRLWNTVSSAHTHPSSRYSTF